jgi:hypothetical protein
MMTSVRLCAIIFDSYRSHCADICPFHSHTIEQDNIAQSVNRRTVSVEIFSSLYVRSQIFACRNFRMRLKNNK